jgi:nucleoside-diphosphate-sugar epimerase
MRIIVTGGSGKLGRACVAELLAHHHEVWNADLVPSTGPATPYTRVDLTDFGQVYEMFRGIDEGWPTIDGILHLAAIPGPGQVPNAALFANNMRGDFNVFSAARHAGIRNIVWASSETVLGLPFDTPPPYAPLDEDYAVRPETAYSLAKSLTEAMARDFCRWDPELKMIGLRFSNVMEPSDYTRFPSFDADPQLRKWNLWSYIDARDGAQAARLALEHRSTGTEVFIIANADTVMTRSSASLMAEVFPDVPLRKRLAENETLLSIDNARRVLGYEPRHSWRDEVAGPDPSSRPA